MSRWSTGSTKSYAPIFQLHEMMERCNAPERRIGNKLRDNGRKVVHATLPPSGSKVIDDVIIRTQIRDRFHVTSSFSKIQN